MRLVCFIKFTELTLLAKVLYKFKNSFLFLPRSGICACFFDNKSSNVE